MKSRRESGVSSCKYKCKQLRQCTQSKVDESEEEEDNDPNKYYAYRKMRYDLSVPEFLGK